MLAPQTLRHLLGFYIDAGVDCALSDEPTDRLNEREPAAAPVPTLRHPPGSLPAPPQAPLPAPPRPPSAPLPFPHPPATAALRHSAAPDIAIAAAQHAAREAATCAALREAMAHFDGCTLAHTAAGLVFADGNPRARIMFVGGIPEREDDLAARPFAGRDGALLDRMIAAIGLDRSRAYFATVIPWKPPGSRPPTLQETEICLPFIRRHVDFIDPDLLIVLGDLAAQTLLSTRDPITRIHGRWIDYATGQRQIRALPSFHPAQLLKSPALKRLAWADLQIVAGALAGLADNPRP
ncbi:MAG: uracil-DNA glycosylase [Alphaproteobacteria bacterium]|nr:uracil-DNA glycosylase [Alphaproteobacteria bacterium]